MKITSMNFIRKLIRNIQQSGYKIAKKFTYGYKNKVRYQTDYFS